MVISRARNERYTDFVVRSKSELPSKPLSSSSAALTVTRIRDQDIRAARRIAFYLDQVEKEAINR